MRLKSYFVHSMEEALQRAKVELGDEAMLVDTKRIDASGGNRARMEVVFAAPAIAPPPVVPPSFPLVSPTATSPARVGQFREELTTLLDALNREPDAAVLERCSPANDALDVLRARLIMSDVPLSAADGIVRRARRVFEAEILRDAQLGPHALLEQALPVLAAEWPALPAASGTPRVIALVGPAGAGKTSAIAKLAFRLGVQKRQQVAVLSTDTLRIGAADQLEHLCTLMGVPFEAVPHSAMLPSAVQSQGRRAIVFVDTPGLSAGDGEFAAELAENLQAKDSGITECHLVLPATLRTSALQRHLRQYSLFRPNHLLFSRLDEADLLGPLWDLACDSGLPVRWLSNGPKVPDDILEARPERIAATILGLESPLTAEFNPAPRSLAAVAGAKSH